MVGKGTKKKGNIMAKKRKKNRVQSKETNRPKVERNQIIITPEFESKYEPELIGLRGLAPLDENIITFLHCILISEDSDHWAYKDFIIKDMQKRFRIAKDSRCILTGFNMRCQKDDFIMVHKVVLNPDQQQNFTIDKYQITENGIKWYNLWTKINGLPVPIVPDKSKVIRKKGVKADGHSGKSETVSNGLDIAFGDAQNKQNMLLNVIQTLKDYRAEYQLTIKELADKCGLGYYHCKELIHSANETNKKTPRIGDEKLAKLVHWLKLNKKFKRTEFAPAKDTPDAYLKMLTEIIDYYGGPAKLSKLFGVSPNAIYAVRKSKIFSRKMRGNINKYHEAIPLDKSIPPPEPEPEQQELDLTMPEVKEELEIIAHYPDVPPAPEPSSEMTPIAYTDVNAHTNGNGNGKYNIEIVQGYLLKDLIITRNKLEKANAELTELRIENRVLQELLKKKIDSYTV